MNRKYRMNRNYLNSITVDENSWKLMIGMNRGGEAIPVGW